MKQKTARCEIEVRYFLLANLTFSGESEKEKKKK